MKKLLNVIVILIITYSSYGQKLKFGANISYGFGGVKNLNSIEQYYALRVSENADVPIMTINNKQGSIFNIGGILSYDINDMISINSGLQYQSQKNDIELYQKEITDVDGSYRENNSTTNINVSSLIIPITAKVKFGKSNYTPFINGGFSFESRLNKSIDSEETRTDWDANNESFDYNYYVFSDKPLEGFNSTAMNYIIGAGIDFNLDSGQTLFFTVNYTANLGTSELWSKNLNSASVDVGDNNRIFDQSDQQTILSSEGIKINDWKSSNITFSIGILF